ncbi:MAG: hypothetical protein Q9174_000982 [Haloplaca sp. 1 TL-2023]
MGSHPRPHFFISRPDHTITPLLAADELPSYVHIAGVRPVMTQADTQAMMSLGVKERSVGRYEVHLDPSSASIDYGEHASISDASENPSTFQQFAGAQEYESSGDGMESAKRAEGQSGKETMRHSENKSQDNPDQGKPVDVENWRQDIKPVVMEEVEATQAKIDALVAAGEDTSEEHAEAKTKEERPTRTLREKPGFVPGKKVYCSHWIRTGECDFIQVGCLYKHEMPDDATLRAIGIRVLPAWYCAAHPDKARERGFGRGAGAVNGIWQRPSGTFPAVPSASFRTGPYAQPPQFRPAPSFGFAEKPDAAFLRGPGHFSSHMTGASFHVNEQPVPYPRIQELSDQQYQQWQARPNAYPADLQVVRRPYRSPGYKTFPFQLPAPVTAPAHNSDVLLPKPAPVWEPRESKLTNGLAYRDKEVKLDPAQEGAETKHMTSANVKLEHHEPRNSIAELSNSKASEHQSKIKVEDPSDSSSSSPDNCQRGAARVSGSHVPAGFAPLKPSPPSPRAPATLERKKSVSSDLFALAPKVSPPPHKRLFVPRGNTSSKPVEPERWKKAIESEIKKAAASVEKEQKVKRAAKGHQESSELLLDLRE